MPTHRDQLSLFDTRSINVAAELKRQIRLALGESRFSRDEICDQVNRLAAIEGIRRSLTKARGIRCKLPVKSFKIRVA
ncbi:MAG: hypothetical protein JW847_01430 [Candidatus Omnitrophica bacterium]|nr:hypothetical protein [Candidatus Omnitrophota bacterium]